MTTPLRGTGTRVNVLSPGPTLTELAAEVVGRDAMIEMGASTPIGHVGDPLEVAAAAAFLASSDSSFMTGSELFTDGGLAQIEETLPTGEKPAGFEVSARPMLLAQSGEDQRERTSEAGE